jgi:hypothetical protein
MCPSAPPPTTTSSWRDGPPRRPRPGTSFAQNKGFEPRTHSNSSATSALSTSPAASRWPGRSYFLTGDGMRLHQAVLRYALDFMTSATASPPSVPVLVREEAMVGTGFFPAGREQAYHRQRDRRRGGGSRTSSSPAPARSASWAHAGRDPRRGRAAPQATSPSAPASAARPAPPARTPPASTASTSSTRSSRSSSAAPTKPKSRRWHQKMIGFVETCSNASSCPTACSSAAPATSASRTPT